MQAGGTKLGCGLAFSVLWAGLFGSFALLPLLTQVGRNFEYEYGLLAGWSALALLPTLCACVPLHGLLRLAGGFPEGGFWRPACFVLVALPGLSFAMGSFAYATLGCHCSGAEGLFWAAVNAYPALILAEALGYAVFVAKSAALSERPRCERRGVVSPQGKLSLLLLAAVLSFYALAFLDLGYELWFFPQKRTVHAVFGFLHGPIYDEWVGVDAGVLGLRSAHLALSLALFSALYFRHHPKLQKAFAVFFLAAALLLRFAVQAYPSVGKGLRAFDAVLEQTLHRPEFALHYQGSAFGQRPLSSVSPAEAVPLAISQLERETAFHIRDLKAQLGLQKVPYVHLYVYPDLQTKKLLFGGAGTDITDVHTPSIHLNPSAGLYPTLRHELVHALLASEAFFGLGFHPNMALTEGLAVALAPELRLLSLDASAAALSHAGSLPAIEALFSPLAFWQAAGPNAYAAAGSFVGFLLAQYGAASVLDLYRGRSFEQVFALSAEALSQLWQQKILSSYQETQDALLAESLFREPSLLAARCPHSQVLLAPEFSAQPFISLRRPRGWRAEQDYRPWRRRLEPGSLALQLESLQEEAAHLLVASQPAPLPWTLQQKVLALVKKVRSWRHPELRVLEDAELALLESDLLRLSDPEASRREEQLLEVLSEQKNLGAVLERQIQARRLVELALSPEQALPWRWYLAGWGELPARLAVYRHPLAEPWILQYLRLRNGHDKEWQPLPLLQAALRAPQGLPTAAGQSLALAWYHLLAQKFWALQAYGLASEAWKDAAELAPSGMHAGLTLLQRMALSLKTRS